MSLLTTTAATICTLRQTKPAVGGHPLAVDKITLTCYPVPELAPDTKRLSIEDCSVPGLICRVGKLCQGEDILCDFDIDARLHSDHFFFHFAVLHMIWRALVQEAEDRPALVRAALQRTHKLASAGLKTPEIALGSSGRDGTTGTTRLTYDPRIEWTSDELRASD